MRPAWQALGVAAALVLMCPDLPAQALSLSAARHLGSPSRTQWTAGYSQWQAGPLDATLFGTSVDGKDGQRYGLGLELGLLRGSLARWYGAAGGFVGFGSRGADALIAGWSAGAGYDLLRLGPVALAAEARYVGLSHAESAVSLGLRLGLRIGSGSGGRRPEPRPEARSTVPVAMPAASTLPEERSARVQAVIQTALDVMGTPYVWGGSDANGFDCSGLIHYAYRTHGILLPRRSVDQAREGAEVGRDPFALAPGDILTFAMSDAGVSHVGLYLGEGRFLHSGSRGVELSTLRPTDPVGRHWWDRWVGARRLVR